jgi:hypothetical protein
MRAWLWVALACPIAAGCGSERGEGATTSGRRGRGDGGPTPVEIAQAELRTAARSVTVVVMHRGGDRLKVWLTGRRSQERVPAEAPAAGD